MIRGFTRTYKPLEFLTTEEVESIHRGALFVLEKTGMRIDHDRALELLADNGCKVDRQAKRARIPAWLVEDCLRKCPSHFRLRARDPDRDVMAGGNTVYFMQGMGMNYVDLDTWETRPATSAEHREAMIVADALENVHLADGWEIYTAREGIPPVMALLENLASGIRYSSKTQVAGNVRDTEIFAIKMAQAVGTDLYPEIENVSPLTIPAGGVDAAYRYIEAGMPIAPAPCTSMGGDAPVTLAGSTVLTTAMVMGWAVLTQLIKPGAAISFATGSGPFDMRTGASVMTPSDAVQTGMMNQILRWYQIPVWTDAGWASTSKKFDYQTAFEKTSGILASALTGGHLLLFQGGSAVELLYHPVLSIMDDEIAAWVGRYLQGVNVTDETLAIDVINQVGPSPGHYLGTAHTREWWQKEHVFPRVRDVQDYPSWLRTGKKDMLDLAKARMEEILATHKPTPLTPGQEQALEDILKEARDYFRKKGAIAEDDWATYMKTLRSGS